MAFFAWTPEYSVGVKELDDHHKRMFGMINDVHNCIKSDRGDEEIGKVIKELVEYTKYHFIAEEKLMLECKYAGYREHEKEHKDFMKKVMVLSKEYMGDVEKRMFLSLKIAEFLKDWLSSHVLGTDTKYGSFFNEKGIR